MFTDNVNEVLIGRVPADKLTVPDPATAVAAAPQVLVSPFGVATPKQAGRLSVKATPVSGMGLIAGLVMVKVSEVEPFNGMLAAPKALVMVGGVTTTRFAVAVLPVPPLVEETLPVVFTKFPDAVPVIFTVTVHVVLFCVPAAVPVTFTEKVHEVLCASVAPDRLMTLVACVAVIVPPPHEPARPLGVETTRPAGSVSLKAMPVRVVVVLLF